MMFLACSLRSTGMSHRPPDALVSGVTSLASLHAVMHALQPMQRVASYNIPTASGRATTAAACVSCALSVVATMVAVAAAITLRAERLDMPMCLLFLWFRFRLGIVGRAQFSRRHETCTDQSAADQPGHTGGHRTYAALRRVDRRVGVGRRHLVDLHGLEHRDAERDAFLCTSNARCPDPDRPHVGNLVEVSRRASRVCVGSLAAHLIQTPAFAVAVVAVLLYEAAGIKVRSARALVMNVAIKRELETPLLIEFRQRAGFGKLQDYPEQRVGIGWTSRDVYDRLLRQQIGDADRTRWIRIGRRNPSPGCAGTDGDYGRSLSRHVGEDFHGWPPGQLHIDALIPSGDRALDHADVLTGVIVHGLRERFFGLLARTRH